MKYDPVGLSSLRNWELPSMNTFDRTKKLSLMRILLFKKKNFLTLKEFLGGKHHPNDRQERLSPVGSRNSLAKFFNERIVKLVSQSQNCLDINDDNVAK